MTPWKTRFGRPRTPSEKRKLKYKRQVQSSGIQETSTHFPYRFITELGTSALPAVSMKEVLAAIGTEKYDALYKRLGAIGITTLAGRLGEKGLAVEDWADNWGKVENEAFGTHGHGAQKTRTEEKPVPAAPRKKPVPQIKETQELAQLKKLTLQTNFQGLMAALGPQETTKLIKSLAADTKRGALIVATHITSITDQAKTGHKARELFRDQKWRF